MSELGQVKSLTNFISTELYVVYGQQGSGKTTIGASAPEPILFINIRDSGLESAKTDNDDINAFITYTQPEDTMRYDNLIDELMKDNKYNSVVIDTFTQLQELEVDLRRKKSNRATITQQQWGDVSNAMKDRVVALKRLSEKKIVIVNCQERKDEGQTGEDYELIPEVYPALIPSVSTNLCSNARGVLHTTIVERDKEVKDKNGNTTTKKVQIYCVQPNGTGVYKGKIQKRKTIELPNLMPNFTFGKLFELLKEDK
jgi:hypothetical protein